MSGKYSALDDLVLAAVRAGLTGFTALLGDHGVRQELKTLAAAEQRAPDWRILDRRLQALRKGGRLQYSRTAGWALKEA